MVAAAPLCCFTILSTVQLRFLIIDIMDKPTAAQQAYAAYAEVVGAATTRLKVANTKLADIWANNKPKTLIGWTVRR
jgi:hypothetical protein